MLEVNKIVVIAKIMIAKQSWKQSRKVVKIELINKTIPLFIDETGNIVKQVVTDPASVCMPLDLPQVLGYGIWLLFLLLIFLFRKQIKNKIDHTKGNMGYIKVWVKLSNQKIKEKLIRVDEHNNFNFKKGKYNNSKLQDFVIGYDKNNIPIYFYNQGFVFPMKNVKVEITDKIKQKLIDADLPHDDETIQAFEYLIDANMFYTAWDRKLMRDLYDASKKVSMDMWKWIAIGLIGVAIFIMVQTGTFGEVYEMLQNTNK